MKKKTVLLGITGGIAAGKIPELIKLLQKDVVNVLPIMTKSACRIIDPKEIERVAKHKVYKDLFEKDFDPKKVLKTRKVEHIEIADQADLVVIVPATANILAKMAHGIADDFLTTVILATRAPILVCPSMNSNMWSHPVVQENLLKLIQRGIHVLEPTSGMLACGYEGKGRLPDANTILSEIRSLISRTEELKEKTVLVTAGGTIEPIDDVRHVSNKSSGKMGVALADACARRGAKVILLKAKNAVMPRSEMIIYEFETAAELDALLHKIIKRCDICFHAAAVSDFTVSFSPGKRHSDHGQSLHLIPREKIYKGLKKENAQLLLFLFKAVWKESRQNVIKKTNDIFHTGDADGIIINDVGEKGRGFAVDTNEVTILTRNGDSHDVPLASKREVAEKIIDILLCNKHNETHIS